MSVDALSSENGCISASQYAETCSTVNGASGNNKLEYELFQAYEKAKKALSEEKRTTFVDLGDVCRAAWTVVRNSGGEQYHAIAIDDAHTLPPAALLVLLELCADANRLLLCVDTATSASRHVNTLRDEQRRRGVLSTITTTITTITCLLYTSPSPRD